MIIIADLKPSDIGRWVEYRGGATECERGRIKVWNDRVVWVVYACAGEWDRFQDYTAVATNSSDLHWVEDDPS